MRLLEGYEEYDSEHGPALRGPGFACYLVRMGNEPCAKFWDEDRGACLGIVDLDMIASWLGGK